MRGILLARFTAFIRNPWIFILFTVMSFLFAFIVGTFSDDYKKITVPISGEAALQTGWLGKTLEENDLYDFKWQERETLEESVRRGNVEAGIIMEETGYEIIVGVNTPNVQLLERTISEIFKQKIQEQNIVTLYTGAYEKEFLASYQEAMETPVFTIKNQSFHSEATFLFDQSLHSIFGFTLFFVIYTIAYNVLPILVEKKEGLWDRMILSPLKKWEMYVANLLYSLFEGYLQVVIIFLAFRYFIGIDFNGKLLGVLLIMLVYTFTIVALAIFLAAVVKSIQQFHAVLPIMSVSMAMIGGAFWPKEIVESEILLTLAKFNPLTYGMEALNGLVIYNMAVEEILWSVGILFIVGVVLIGIGIGLMERRYG